ncbi:5'-3' exonuclease FEN1 [Methanonatronarchaeum thermophilum]|uniref:Flap endonuclease 1 n=1 Tax=Methanonatronarchaeum thermophilum TaxID=1927129 RepID=A0A1Y3GDY2_9EURY|nr:flap endonuclease-1 [Methanonatronarchaeum thermophilum]OUJ19427.1 5'-3' exonuclease FEN1 [Methanonatronarchaeum thermophilum]
MGSDIGDIVSRESVSFSDMQNRTVAIDANNTLYQFLSIIRQPDGTPLKDSGGRVTSHVSGVFYRMINLFEEGIEPVYVFDGKPPQLKSKTLDERRKIRENSKEKWKKAKARGDTEEAYSQAMRSSKLNRDMVAESKELLRLMGIPCVQAPSEAEAQAAYIVENGDCWASSSQDYDSLLFGTPILIRNLTITGRRKIPGKDRYKEIKPEKIVLEELLNKLDLNREQLVDLAILVGTDFNDGIKGIGPKTALKLIKEHSSGRKVLEVKDIEIENYSEIREIFIEPEVTDEYDINPSDIEWDGVVEFLCEERDFSEDRVVKGLDRLEKAVNELRHQTTFDSF